MAADAPETLPLAAGFPPADIDRWRDEVRRVLARGRGEPSDEELDALWSRTLETRTHDGLVLRPLYTAADAPPPGSEGLPGLPPFTRGALPRHPGGRWDVRQQVAVAGDGAAARGRAVRELEGGASSVLLDLRGARRIDAALLDRALDGVHLDAAAVGLRAGGRGVEAARALGELWADRGVGDDAARASLGLDPLGEHALTGGAAGPPGEAIAAAAALASEVAARHPRVRSLLADGAPYHDAGASDAQQLACAVATGVEYLRALTDAGLGIADALGQVELRLAAGPQQFPVIAAFRAARRMWARVAEACGAPAPARAARLHAVTSRAMATRYDPWVNLLRGTVACVAAGVGGAEVVTVEPYDAALGRDGGLGARLARNTQSLAIEESGLGRVADPAGGSWYVERLTEELAAAAWGLFQEVEAAGGMAAALEAGAVQDAIGATRRARREAVARRRDPITGVSEFPDIDEEPPPPLAPAAAPSGARIAALSPHRWSEPFEEQRGRADRHAAATGERPRIFLAALGPLAVHTARTGFAANLFAAGGVRPVAHDGLGPDDDAGAAFAQSGAAVACICSSDALYAERGAETAAALARAGAARVYLAGRPGDDAGALRAAGVDAFAHVGCDAVALLADALDASGVAP